MSFFTAQLDALRRDGPARFARWDAALFDAVAAGPARTFARRLAKQADAAEVFAGYLRLVEEGIGRGVVRRAGPGPGGWTNVLERLLLHTLPEQLHDLSPADRLPRSSTPGTSARGCCASRPGSIATSGPASTAPS